MNNSYFAKPPYPIWQPDKGTPGTLLYMPFAEGSGPTVRDYANSYTGSLEATVTWGKSFHGPALSFLGTGNGAATILDPRGRLAGMAQLTFAVMYLARGTGGSAAGRILTQNDTSGYALQLSGANLQANVGGIVITATGGAVLNTLTVAVVTYDGATIRLYINGVLSASGARTGAVPASTAGVVIGNRPAGAREFSGLISSAHVANRAFGAAEVQALTSDWLSGQFSAVRPRSSLALLAATLGGSPPATIFARRGRSFRVGSRGVA